MIRQRNRIGIELRIGIRNGKVSRRNERRYKVVNGIRLYRIKIKNIMTIKSVTVVKELM